MRPVGTRLKRSNEAMRVAAQSIRKRKSFQGRWMSVLDEDVPGSVECRRIIVDSAGAGGLRWR